MKNISKKISLIALAAFSTTILSTNTHANFVSNDGENLAQCRNLIQTKFGEFDRIKTSNIKSKARSFSVKFKTVNNGDKSIIECKLTRNEAPALTCLKGNACSASTSLSNEK